MLISIGYCLLYSETQLKEGGRVELPGFPREIGRGGGWVATVCTKIHALSSPLMTY